MFHNTADHTRWHKTKVILDLAFGGRLGARLQTQPRPVLRPRGQEAGAEAPGASSGPVVKRVTTTIRNPESTSPSRERDCRAAQRKARTVGA